MALAANALTITGTVRDELGISGDRKDHRIDRVINAVSQELEDVCGRVFGHVAGLVEKQPTFGTPTLILDRPPIFHIQQIKVDDTIIDAADYEIEDSLAGFVRRLDGRHWSWTALRRGDIARDRLPGTEEKATEIIYDAGWVLPKDHRRTSKLTGSPALTFADDNPDTITRASGSWLADGFVADQIIRVLGSTSNDGLREVTTVTALVLTLATDEALTAEVGATGVVVTSAVRLPFDIEDAVIDECVSRFRQKGRDQRITSEKALSQSVTYAAASAGGIDYVAAFERIAERYMRRRFG